MLETCTRNALSGIAGGGIIKICNHNQIKTMSLLGIIFVIVLIALIGKAILETIWGSILVINGLFWHTIAFALRTLANAIRLYKRIVGLFRKPKPAAKQFSMAHALNTYFASTK